MLKTAVSACTSHQKRLGSGIDITVNLTNTYLLLMFFSCLFTTFNIVKTLMFSEMVRV